MSWRPICDATALQPERGVAALLPDGVQVALFRLSDGRLFALGNRDPFSGANVMSRGILGDRDGRPTVASPMHKQVFDLATGACLDDESVSLPTYEVTSRAGRIEVAVGQLVAIQ